jgi:hypothetical protein
MTELIAYEQKRGCGYRQVGKLYLVGEGIAWVCPSLPLIFKPCDCCGYEPPQYRDFQWLGKAYVKHIREPTGKACHPECPICYPSQNPQERYGLMWVGKKFYDPIEFIEESEDQGVSKAIKQIPKGLVLGKTWVLLAHPQAVVDREDPEFQESYVHWLSRGVEKIPPDPEPQPPTHPGVFFAFIPQRVEMPIYESEATPERLRELEAKGITPVIILDDGTAHGPKTRRTRTRKNIGKRADDE